MANYLLSRAENGKLLLCCQPNVAVNAVCRLPSGHPGQHFYWNAKYGRLHRRVMWPRSPSESCQPPEKTFNPEQDILETIGSPRQTDYVTCTCGASWLVFRTKRRFTVRTGKCAKCGARLPDAEASPQ